MLGTATQKPARGTAKRQKAARKRLESKADRLVYAAVDARDGHRCRVCLAYCGLDIQRHHILYRSKGGQTTTANVVSLCPECHLVGVHGGRIVIAGDANGKLSLKCATASWNGKPTHWAVWEGAAV